MTIARTAQYWITMTQAAPSRDFQFVVEKGGVATNVTPDSIDARWTAALPSGVSDAEVTSLTALVLRDGVSTHDLAFADQLVRDLEASTPDRASWLVQARNAVTSYADEHAANLAAAGTLKRAVHDQSDRVLIAQSAFGARPAHASVEHSRQALDELCKRDFFHPPPAASSAQFLHEMQAFAQAAGAEFAPGPERVQAMACAFSAFSARFFVHTAEIGKADIRWPGGGVPTFDLLFAGKPHEHRTVIDCEGFCSVAINFFVIAGGAVSSKLCGPKGELPDHAITKVQLDGFTLVTSNDQACVVHGQAEAEAFVLRSLTSANQVQNAVPYDIPGWDFTH
jgi:hypothetical protein